MANLKEKYNNELRPALKEELGIDNIMAVPKLTKVVINMGVGEAANDKKHLESALENLTVIAGQKPVVTKARQSVASFKIREGWPLGCKVTLRGNKMYEFLMKLLHLALPRVRDFRGISRKAFDKRGNYNLGIQDHLIFPEIDTTNTSRSKGLNITIVTTAQNDDGALILMEKLGFPFKKK